LTRQTASEARKITAPEIREFKKAVLDFYEAGGRSFPWRYAGTPDPWGVVVSEFMLQQTQTRRVVPYWERWMELWPRPADLAAAPLETVLKEWSGLGYNRRAKRLRDCAAEIAARHGGTVPREPETLLTLPGIGPYTAGAVACFAWNHPAVFIETNIRAVLLHFFFRDRTGVGDGELVPVLERTLDRANPRTWYWALMDYGAELKKLTANPNRRSARYAKQSRFEGSFRQIRGTVIRILSAEGPQKKAAFRRAVQGALKDMREEDYRRALEILEKEMMVTEEGGVYRIGR